MTADRYALRFTDHAIRQYRKRYQPDLSFDECARVLTTAAPSAKPNPDRRCYRDSATVWRIGTLGDVDAVVVQDHDGPLAVTIYWPRQVSGRAIDPAELAEAEERLRRAEQAQATAARAVEAAPPPLPPPPPQPKGNDTFETWQVAKARFKAAQCELLHAQLVTAVIRDELRTLRHEISRTPEIADLTTALRLALYALSPELRAAVRAEISKFSGYLATDEWLMRGARVKDGDESEDAVLKKTPT